MPKVSSDAGLRIGMVSRLSGVPTATIRMWERRYAALKPSRSAAGGRLYSRTDVARLGLLKQLVDRGHAIGTVAKLAEAQLHELMAEPAPTPATGASCRIAAAGSTLARRLRAAAAAQSRVQWVGDADSIERLLPVVGHEALDALIVEMPTLGPQQAAQVLELLHQLRPRLLVVVYAFAAERDLAQLRLDAVLLVKGRMDAAQLLRVCLLSVNMQPADERGSYDGLLGRAAPQALYSEAELAEMAALPNAIRCECPRHLSELLLSLGAFERYSVACQNRNEDDAAVHAMLRTVSGHARALLEDGLQRVIALEARLGE